ncbi:hypothetical protein ACHAXT_012608 [Thalassiosira profunda]
MSALESKWSSNVPSAAVGGDGVAKNEADAVHDTNDYWNDLPKGVQDAAITAAAQITKGRSRTLGPEGYIVSFIVYSSQLFTNDNEYSWNLWRSLRSSYILATTYLLRKMHDEALLMVFFAAFLEECLARGHFAATNKLLPSENRSVVADAQGRLAHKHVVPVDAWFSIRCFCYAAINTKTSWTMAAFLR